MRKLRLAKHKWPNMGEHVKIFLRTCSTCQKMSQIKPVIFATPFTNAAYRPMDVLNVDSIGPVTTDLFGNCYIIVIICCFTRFVELYAAPDTTALSAARALLNHHGCYGVPNKIRTDRGSQYANELITKFCALVGSETDLTTAYWKEENGIVERANKEVMRHLRAIVFDRRVTDHWSSDYLPLVQRIINANISTPIGVSPAQLLFGDAVHLERGILLPHKEVTEGEEIPLYLKRLLSTQSDLIKIAQENQLISDNQHMANSKPQRTEFQKGEYVLLSHPGEKPEKMKMKLQGPYKVVESKNSSITIEDLTDHKHVTVHITNLRPYHFDPDVIDPAIIAMHDKQEFAVERILDHRGDKKIRSNLEFLVKWKGYDDESQNSWEPWSGVRNTVQLHEYLRDNKMKSLINKRCYQD